MKIILQKEVAKLGGLGEIVQVADGYARNYLIPRGLAAPATKGAVRHADRLKAGHEERQRRALADAEALAARLAKTPVRIAAQAGEEQQARPDYGVLGTDGAASNNDLDMFEAMRMTAFLHKLQANDPKALPAPVVLELATRIRDLMGADVEIKHPILEVSWQ
jgi:large subunit ribosomal protein L9